MAGGVCGGVVFVPPAMSSEKCASKAPGRETRRCLRPRDGRSPFLWAADACKGSAPQPLPPFSEQRRGPCALYSAGTRWAMADATH